MGNVMVWLWRLVTTAIVAFGVWGIWWQTVQLEVLNAELLELLDYIAFELETAE